MNNGYYSIIHATTILHIDKVNLKNANSWLTNSKYIKRDDNIALSYTNYNN